MNKSGATNYAMLLTAPLAALAQQELPWRKTTLYLLGIQLPLSLAVAAQPGGLFG